MMNIKIENDFIVFRISHPTSINLNLKGYTIKQVLFDKDYNDFYVYFHEDIPELEVFDDEVWFSKEFGEEEYNRMRNIVDGGKDEIQN